MQAFDAQRIAFAKDATHLADQAIATGGTQVRALVREMFVYGILLYVVILGVPFAAGYFFGRLRAQTMSPAKYPVT